MSVARFLWSLICYRPARYACISLVRLACYAERIIFGLVLQTFFNTLSMHTQLTPGQFAVFVPWIIAIVARLLIVYVGTASSIHFDFSASSLLQYNLFKHILQRPGARAVPASVGETISHFRDDTSIVVELLVNLGDACALIIYTIVVFIILFRVNMLITLLVFLPLCCIVALARRTQKGLEKFRTASRAATGAVTGAIGEIFAAVQAIQVARAERHMLAYFNALNQQRRSSMLKDRVMSGALDALFGNVGDIGKALILVFAALSLSSGQLRAGDLVIFMTYLSIVTDFFNDIGNLLAQYTQTRVSFERLLQLLQGAPAQLLVQHHPLYLYGRVPELPATLQTDIQPLETLVVRQLDYRYPETGRGISAINLSIEHGTFTVITGRIGAGKTTLLQTLLGLLPADAGEIVWNDHPIADPAAFFVPHRSAYTAQVPRLFSDTLKENILLGLPERSVDLSAAIQAVVLDQDIATFAQGLETQIGVRGVKLSGGQIQRVAAARMLVRTPELFVCDDLSSALDVETEQQLWDQLLAAGLHTYIAVSHRRSVLQRAHQVILLKDGRVEAVGPLEMLLKNSAEMRSIWQGQHE